MSKYRLLIGVRGWRGFCRHSDIFVVAERYVDYEKMSVSGMNFACIDVCEKQDDWGKCIYTCVSLALISDTIVEYFVM